MSNKNWLVYLKSIEKFYLITRFPVNCLIKPNLCVIPATRASSDLFGGLQCFFPDSWQQTFGKQSNVLLHGFGWLSNICGGGGVHWRYPATASKAAKR